jgi:hypothetical protein
VNLPTSEPERDDNNGGDARSSMPGAFWIALLLTCLLAIPESRFQGFFKLLAWTLIVFGPYCSYVWPHIHDIPTVVAFGLVCVTHILIVFLLYQVVRVDGFLVIGATAIAELLLFSIPAGWIIVHSRSSNSQR